MGGKFGYSRMKLMSWLCFTDTDMLTHARYDTTQRHNKI